MRTMQLQKALDTTWTVHDLADRFRVTTMTIYNWRKERQLPTLVIEGVERPALRFVEKDVRVWAKKNNVTMFEPSGESEDRSALV